jgi:flagellar hook-associated protein 2
MIDDVIEGATFLLQKDAPTTTVTVNVTKETDSVKAKINALVTAYNAAMSSVKDLIGTKDKAGTIGTDSTMRSIQTALRNVVTDKFGNNSLTLLGFTHDKNGTLMFDAATFDKALSANETDVVATVNAMATSFEETLTSYEKTIIPGKQQAYDATTKLLQKREEALQMQLDKTEIMLKKKYNNLDQVMSQLQGRSTYLTQQAAANSNSSK